MKERTIVVKGAPFTYMGEEGDPYVFNPVTSKEMTEMLALTAKLLDDCGISFFLAFGSLLGSVREGNLIKGDDDVDVIVMDEKMLYDSLPYMDEQGLHINRIFKTELYTFHTDGRNGHVDMYILRPIDKWLYKNWCVSIRGHYAPKRCFGSIDPSTYRIGEKTYPCPTQPEKLLEWWYGKTWRVPQSRKAIEDVLIRRIVLFPSKCTARL